MHFVFHISQQCRKLGKTVSSDACFINPGPDDLSNISFGQVTKGKFEPDADIAGKGVVLAFLISGVMLAAVGSFSFLARLFYSGHLLFYRKSFMDKKKAMGYGYEKHAIIDIIHTFSDPILLSGSDTQLLLIIAYGYSFWKDAKCTISDYHYNVALYVIVFGLLTFTLCLSLVRKYFENVISSILRLLVAFAVIVIMTTLFSNQQALAERVAWHPPLNFTATVIFLPALCFLDPDQDPLGNITSTSTVQKIAPGFSRTAQGSPLRYIFIFFVVCFLLALILRGAVYAISKDVLRVGPYWIAAIEILKLVIIIGVFSMMIVDWKAIMSLKDWVDRSGWIKLEDGQNPEKSITGIGQLAPIVALFTTFISFTDALPEVISKLREYHNKRRPRTKPEYARIGKFLLPQVIRFGERAKDDDVEENESETIALVP